MRRNQNTLKTLATLLVTVMPFVPAFGGPNTNAILSRSSQESHIPDSNRGGATNSVPEGRGWLGLVISGAPEGALVERVVVGGPAWHAGIHSDDVIVATDKRLLSGLPLPTIAKLLSQPIGSELGLTISRAGQLLKLKVKRESVRPSPDIIGL